MLEMCNRKKKDEGVYSDLYVKSGAEGIFFNTVCVPLRFSHFRPAIKLTGGMLFDQSRAYLLPALLIYSQVVASFQGYVTTVATVAVFTNSQLELTTRSNARLTL